MPLARRPFTHWALRPWPSGRDLVGTIAVLFLKEIPLRGGRTRKATNAELSGEEVPEAESNLVALV